MINNSRGVKPTYLSPEYMDLVKTVVQQCKKNGMKVWIEGDCGYPDGFAGGLISKDYPQLGMQGIISDAHCTVAAGQTLDIPSARRYAGHPGQSARRSRGGGRPLRRANRCRCRRTGSSTTRCRGAVAGRSSSSCPTPKSATMFGPASHSRFRCPPARRASSSAVRRPRAGRRRADDSAARRRSGRSRRPRSCRCPRTDGSSGRRRPARGSWELTFIRHAYRSSPTRNDNGEDGGATKDGYYSLIDYLDPAATDTYLRIIYEVYEKAVGDEFGKTVLGFRGDETDFTGVSPWTPKLLETFQAVKGYDFKPYIPLIFGGRMTPEAQRAKADYWDVWSGMFRDNFYKRMEDWCTARNMEFMVHLNHEELMMSGGGDMIKNEGSFWRNMRYVGVPGVDNLNQIKPDLVADFPKLAASAAHVMGRPLVWDEEGGGTGPDGKFVVDYQLVRGINYMNIRGLASAGGGSIGWYVSRSQHLLAIGRPVAQVAYLHPTDSMWMNDKESDTVTLKLVTQLLEHQIDFDHIDADELAGVVALEGGGLKNLSGQTYRAVIVPTSTVIQKAVLERLRAFAAGGGKVVFVGRTPTMVVGRTFLHPEAGAPDLSFATLEPTPEITARVVAALPPPDAKLDTACPPIKYLHRALADGDVYFFFNESSQTQTRDCDPGRQRPG